MSELKTKRSLSGIFLKFENPETGKHETWCFEDLPEDVQDKWLNSLNDSQLFTMVETLNKTLVFVLETNGIYSNGYARQIKVPREYCLEAVRHIAGLINAIAAVNDMRAESEIPENEREQFKKME